jgi:hypothetical protein
MKEIVMDMPKEVAVTQSALEAPRVVDLGQVSEETKGASGQHSENNMPSTHS